MRPKNAWHFCTDISAGSNGNFGGKKQEESLTAGYVVFEKSCPWVRQSLQFVQNQNIVKTRLVFEHPGILRRLCDLSHARQNYWTLIGWERGHFFLITRALLVIKRAWLLDADSLSTTALSWFPASNGTVCELGLDNNILKKFLFRAFYYKPMTGRYKGLMVSAFDSGLSGPGSSHSVYTLLSKCFFPPRCANGYRRVSLLGVTLRWTSISSRSGG